MLDELRYELACKSDNHASSFPLTEDAVHQHVLHVKYQVSIWMQCDITMLHLLNLISNGWRWNEDTSSMEPVY